MDYTKYIINFLILLVRQKAADAKAFLETQVMSRVAKYIINILIWIDQGANVIFSPILNILAGPTAANFGDPDETLSSVFGKNAREGKCVMCKIMCRILNWIDPRHCDKSIERDEGKSSL